MRYVWLVEGEPYAGTLNEYASALEEDHYAEVGVSAWLWILADGAETLTGGFRLVAIEPQFHITEHNDVQTMYVIVGADEARFKIDLRT